MFHMGQKSKAICECCEKIVTTTFKYRDVKIKDKDIVVPHLLVGVCDTCDETVSIPSTATPQIKEALNK